MATSSTSTNQIRILLLGDSATGKCSYIKRLTHHTFSRDSRVNKECDTVSTRITVDENKEVSIQILNVAGSQREQTKQKDYFKNIDGCIIMFDVTRAGTYDGILGWKTDLDRETNSKNLPVILLANKCDLEKDQGLNVVMSTMDEYCQAIGFLSYFEISNRNNINIETSIKALIREIIERRNSSESTSPPSPLSVLTPSDNMVPLADRKREYTFKILVIGDKYTGKTAFIQRYAQNTYIPHYRATIGSDIALKIIKYNDDITVRIHLWDIAGDERFSNMTHLFYKDAAGCLIVFDVSQPLSLTNGAAKWKDDFDKKVVFDDDSQVPCLLIGNKCDLKKEGVVTSQAHLDQFCRTHNFTRSFETSAKENINVGTSMLFLIDEIIKNTDKIKYRRTSSIQLLNQTIPRQRSWRRCWL